MYVFWLSHEFCACLSSKGCTTCQYQQPVVRVDTLEHADYTIIFSH